MKNTGSYFFFLFLFFSIISCHNDNDDVGSNRLQISINQENTGLVFYRNNYGDSLSAGIKVQLSELSGSPVSYEFRILETSTAMANVHYAVNAESGFIPANTWDAELPIIIFPDSLNANESWTLDIELVSSDIAVADSSPVHFTLKVLCLSDLAGTYNAESHLDEWGCGTWMGIVKWEQVDSNNYLLYSTDENQPETLDFSMGAYWGCFGYSTQLPSDENEGDLLLHDDCGTLSFTGTDRWGDGYFFYSIFVDGPKVSFFWKNDYGEAGWTTLIRQDGSDWPNLSI